MIEIVCVGLNNSSTFGDSEESFKDNPSSNYIPAIWNPQMD